MAAADDRRIGFLFGVLAAVLLLVAALLSLIVGIAFLVTGAFHPAAGSIGASVIEVVVALLIGFFAFLGRGRGGDRSVTAGIVLIVLAVVGWLALGFGGSLLAILASIFALIAGVLFVLAGR
ncbi:MAG TPA: hypothetical protein VMG14_04650 [Thermoplasmata archaeon]|jgi:hypothetical protein|nr:hypothetical protein [Thermoplasmata archaeon]